MIRIVLVALFLLGHANAQEIQTSKIDTLLLRLESQNKAFLSVSVLKEGKTIYRAASGYRSVEDSLRSDAETIYRVGSISKMFTAALIYRLSEDKSLNINDPLEKYFPEIPNADHITLQDMLTHSSGIHNVTSDTEYVGYMTKKQTQRDMLDRIAKHEPDFEPGLKHAYSNSNYILLGYIIEKVTGKTYAAVLEQYITGKLNLNHTHYGDKIEPLKNEAFSYYAGTWERVPETDMSIPHGAGAIVSTPTELTVFIRALLLGNIIGEAGITSMTSIEEGYGAGLFESRHASRIAYGHDGAIDGNLAGVRYFPDEDLAIAVCSNGIGYDLDKIMDIVAGICFGEPVEIPEFKTVVLTPEQLALYEGTFSSQDIPLEIKVWSENGVLMAQAQGQSSFALDAAGNHTFQFDPAGLVMIFDASGNGFVLEQGGGKFSYTKN